MAIRKEQVLALLTLVVAGMVWNGRRAAQPMVASVNPKSLEYEVAPVRTAPLAGAPTVPLARLDFATEPSETQPLPPRPLAFPPRAAIAIVALPLEPGPDYGHALVLAGDGETIEGVTLQAPAAGEDAAPAGTGNGDEPGGGTREEREAAARRSYDRVYLQGRSSPFYGTIEPGGLDRFELEARTEFEGVVVRLRRYSLETGKVGKVEEFGREGNKIEKIVLADTLRNQVVRRTRAVPADAAHLPDRAALIRWLLERAREESWVYDEALAQADLYVQVSGGDLEGLRWQQRVLQAKGDFAAEFALLDGIQGPFRESAFRYEGLGRLKALLGLDADAEADLRKAVALGPTDARPHAALAEFLRARGRSREALASALRAEQAFGSLLDPGDKGRVMRTIFACHLAVAAIDAAALALALVNGDPAVPYLQGVLHYAKGDLPTALAAFRQVAGGPDSGAAQLGQAACLVRTGQWQEAHDLFVRVAEQEPLLRHRAATGLALIGLRLGQYDSALAWLDRAQEADPGDPYMFYLRGAVLRRQGQLDGAEEALAACLRLRDDFVHALVEMTAVHSARAIDGGVAGAQSALAAMRYGERAVHLAHRPDVQLHVLQGLLRFLAADPSGARAAFTAARDLADTEEKKLFARGALAVVDYSRGLREDAETALSRLAVDLAKDHPMRLWAEATIEAIDDHGQKEMLNDRFERNEPGGIWPGERDTTFGAVLRDGALVFDGKLSTRGGGEVWVERAGAVPKAKNFLAVGVKLRLGAKQPRGDGFCGLRIELLRGGQGQFDLRAQIGVFEGRPWLVVAENREDELRRPLELGALDLSQWQDVELRVLPRGEQGRNFLLQASWNGAVVATHELKTLTASAGNDLKTVLFASGSKGGQVEAWFDDYRLERRKDK